MHQHLNHDDNKVEASTSKSRKPKTNIPAVQRDWNAKMGKDAQADWGDVFGPCCNAETNEGGLRLIEFATT